MVSDSNKPTEVSAKVSSALQARVLVVDDDQTFLYALSEGLHIRLNSVNVTTCNSATEALRKLASTDYDAIVSDVKMPGMDGLELLAAIRQRRPDTPVLLITGLEDYRTAVEALRGGAYDLIQKPLNWEYFITSLTSAMQMRLVQRCLQKNTLSNQNSWDKNETLLAGVNVLLVDDDQDGLEMQTTALEVFGAEVLAVGSTSAALNALVEFEPDILVSDIRMPIADGYSLVRQLRRRSAAQGGDIPAIAVTAYGNEEELTPCLRAGFQLQMAKPIEPTALTLAVAVLTGRITNESGS